MSSRNFQRGPPRNKSSLSNEIQRMRSQIAALKQTTKSGSHTIKRIIDPPQHNNFQTYDRVVRIISASDTYSVNALNITGALHFSGVTSALYNFQTIRIWAIDTATAGIINLRAFESTDPTGSAISYADYTDSGTFGAQRPHISVMFSRELRDLWFPGTSTDNIAIVTGAVGFVIDVRVAIRISD